MNSLLLAYDTCHDIIPIIRVVRLGIMPLIQIGIPIVLIVLGTVDLGKAVMASDDKEIKAAQGRLIKRVLYAAVIFFMVTIVGLVFNIVATSGVNKGVDNDWRNCWNRAVDEE